MASKVYEIERLDSIFMLHYACILVPQILIQWTLDISNTDISKYPLIPKDIIWARGYKTFFMLNSVEHEILNAHKYKNINKFSFFQAQIIGEGYFSYP